jgi:hypothetical protein
MNELYLDWLEDNELEDNEENLEIWTKTHCQFCGGYNLFADCGCDHQLRY